MTLLDDATQKLVTGVDELKLSITDAQAATLLASTLNSVVELGALHASSLLEDFLQEAFYIFMLGGHPNAAVGPTLFVSTREDVDLLIYSEGQRREKYLDWLPWDRIEARATAYLRAGRPFDRITFRPVERRALAELTIVRNAVAHPSSYAYTQFEELSVQKGYRVLRPADYLLSMRSGSSEVLLLITQVEIIARAIALESDLSAGALLQPESAFRENQAAPIGEYVCTECGNSIQIHAIQKIGPCPACGTAARCPTCGRVTGGTSAWERLLS